jgi:signal transduction histidine kinase
MIVPERLRATHERGIRGALSGNLPVSGKTAEITGLRKGGQEFPLELTLATWETGEGVFLTAIARDITDRRLAEVKLGESEQRYRVLFEESPIALWEKDCGDLLEHLEGLRRDGVGDFRRYFGERPDVVSSCLGLIRVVDVNKAAMGMYGAASKKELFSGLRGILCGDSAGTCLEALICLAEGKKAFESESSTRTLQGEKKTVILRWAVAPGPGKPSTRLLLSIIDLTSHRKLEAQFLQSQKMEAVGRLAGGVAHDFNNLLSAVTVNADLLLRDLMEGERTHDAARIIGDAAEEAGKLTHQLLALSQRRGAEPEDLNLDAIIRKSSRLFSHLLGEGVRCSLSLDPALSMIRANPGQMEQVVLNLVVNARDAMPDGGSLSIKTGNCVPGGKEDGVPADPDTGPSVKLTVSDSGGGISPQDMEHIFEPFYTTKPEGSGLGLSTVYGIIRQHSGHIAAEERAGGGAVFTVTLPAVGKGGS